MKKILIVSGKHKKYERNYLFFKILEKKYQIIEHEFEGNFFIKNFKALRLFFLKYDLILINWPYWSSFFSINFINFFKNKPIIYDFFTLIEEDYVDNHSDRINSFLRYLYLLIENYIIKNSQGLITDTEIHKKNLLRKKFKSKNQILSFEISQKNKITKKIKKKDDVLNLIHSSANRNMHRADRIIHLIKNLPFQIKKKTKLKMILKDYNGVIGNLINKYNLNDNVEILKRVKKNIFLKAVNNSDVCLGIFGNSNKSKNVISNFIVTSCNYSKMIITKNTPASKYYLKDNPSIFLINSINDNSFLKVIKKIIYTKKMSNLKKSSSKIIFNKNFDINKNSKKLEFFLEQFLN